MNDVYTSIPAPSEGVYKELGSRFIALAYPVEAEDDARALLTKARAQYHDARHHCHAWRIGAAGESWHCSDDGEPSGTAGRQILGRIDSRGLSDVMVIVVRYFGGIKLGVPGLCRAYKSATEDALATAGTVQKTAASLYRIGFGYERMPAVMKIVKDLALPQLGRDFEGAECRLDLRVRLSQENEFLQKITPETTYINKI